MKFFQISILIISLVVFSCSNSKENKKVFTVFSGTIKNPNSDSLSIMNVEYKIIHTFYLLNNKFTDTINIEKGFYYLTDGTETTQIYLEPNFNLNLSLNAKEFDESLHYWGKGAYENNYLVKKTLLNESFGVKNYYGYYAKLDENRFLKDADSIYQIKLDFLNKHKDSLNEEFYFIEYNDIKYGYLNKIAQYEALKRFVMDNNEFTVSVNYPNPFNKVDLTNDLLLNSRNYLDFVDLHIAKITTERINGFDSVDYQIAFLETIKKEIKSTKLKEIMVFKTSISSIDYTEELDRYYGLAKSVLTNESHILELTYKYNKLKRLSKGAASPNFELKDINGNVYNLNDFKGKYVYIDIWATWCLPCLKEIPALMELEKEYKQIQFVSICKDDERESWEKMVKDKQLKGIQLFSSDENISFFEEYMVRGVPRFILIDDNGKIIDANAMRPSNPDIKKVFDDLK